MADSSQKHYRDFGLPIWGILFRPHSSLTSLAEARRAQLQMAFALLLGLLALTGVVISMRNGVKVSNILLLALALSCFLAFSLGHTRWYKLGALLLVIAFSLAGFVISMMGTDNPVGALFTTIPLSLILASVLLPVPILAALTLLDAGAVILLQFMLPGMLDLLAYGMIFLGMGGLLIIVTLFRNSLEKERLAEISRVNAELRTMQNMLEERVEERTQAAAMAVCESEDARQEAEKARQEAEAAWRDLELQIWQVSGLAQLSEVLRGEQDLQTLARNTTSFVCRYLDLPVGLLWGCLSQSGLRTPGAPLDGSIEWLGGYACQIPDQTVKLAAGEGLVGQAILEQHTLILQELPPEVVAATVVATSLVQFIPKGVLILPLIYNQSAIGALELGTQTQFTPAQVQFLERAADSIAIAIHTVQSRQQLNDLLEETRRQAEELQAQEAELLAQGSAQYQR